MKRLYPNLASGFIILFFILLASQSMGQGVFDSNASGNWSLAGSWTLTGGSDVDGVPYADDDVFILSGHNITVNVASTALNLTISSGGILTATSQYTVAGGGSMTVDNGGTYDHAIDGGTIPTATWAATSNFNVTGVTSTAPGGFGQTFGNFTWNSIGQTDRIYMEADIIIQGDFSVLSTGILPLIADRSLRMSNTMGIPGSYTIDVTGNVLVDNSTFKMNNNIGSCIMNIG